MSAFLLSENVSNPNASPGNGKISARPFASENRQINSLASTRSRGSRERPDQRLRRERLGEMGEAPMQTHHNRFSVAPDATPEASRSFAS